MNKEQQERCFDELVQQMRQLISKKREDYAGEDVLSNFKVAGSVCGLSPEQQCLSLVATKVARLGVLLKGKKPNNESIKDSVIDLANYSVLLAMIITEKEAVKVIEESMKDFEKQDYFVVSHI